MKQLKFAYISDQHFPIEKADSEQVINTVSSLTSAGLQIELVIPRNWRTFGLSKAERIKRIADFYHLSNGFSSSELVHLPLSDLRAEKYSHAIVAPLWSRLSGYEVIYTRNPLSALHAFVIGCKVIFETYRLHSNAMARFLGFLSRRRNCLAIITHSEPSRQRLLDGHADPQKITVIPNGFNTELFSQPLSKTAARKKLSLREDLKMACYTGRLDREKGIEALIELAARTPEITYYFIGKAQKENQTWISEACRQKQIKNVHTLPWVEVRELVVYLHAADVLLIPPASAPLHKHGKTVLPMKLFQYLAAGRPVLAPALDDTREVINESNAVMVEPDNTDAAAAGIRRIFEEPEWAERLAGRAGETAQNYTWENRANRIISFIDERLRDAGN